MIYCENQFSGFYKKAAQGTNGLHLLFECWSWSIISWACRCKNLIHRPVNLLYNMLYLWKMLMKISRKQNLNANLHLVKKCIINIMIKSNNNVLCDTATEEYSNQTLVWLEHHLHSIMTWKRHTEIWNIYMTYIKKCFPYIYLINEGAISVSTIRIY